MKSILLALCISLWFGVNYAQTITFKVIDQSTKESLDFVYAQNTETQNTIISKDGKLNLVLSETYLILRMGYEKIEFTIHANSDKIIRLQPIRHELGEVMVSGLLFEDPAMSVTTPDLSKNVVQPKNVADLFENVEGFGIIKRGNYAMDPSFRASQYEQLNIQYDGGTKVMHACPNRMDPITTHVIPEDIQKIEVIRGPYSVRYGATFGGIINMVSKKPEYENYGISGSVSSGFETNGNNSVNLAQLQYSNEKLDLKGSYGYRDFGNYEDGEGTEIPSSFRSIDYGIRLGYNFSTNERLKIDWRQSFGRDVLHASLPMDSDFDDSSILSLDYHKKNISEALEHIKAKAYYSFVDHLMSNSRRANFQTVEAVSPVEATTAGGRFEMKWKFSDKWTTYTGTDALLISREGVRNRLVKRNMMGMPLDPPLTFVDKIWQDSYINDFGLFAETTYQMNESTSFNAGLRYDVVISDIQDPESDFLGYYPNLDQRDEHNISGTVSLKKRLKNQDVLEIAFGRGVRSANMIERAINHFQVGQDPFEYVGNPNLDAEVNNQIEVAYRGNLQTEGFISNIEYNASAYYSLFENYIVAIIDETKDRKFMPNVEPTNPKVFRNLDEAYKTGFEVGVGFDFYNNFQLNANAAYVYTRNEDLNESLPLTSPLRSNFELNYSNDKFYAGIFYEVVAKQRQLASSFGELQSTPGYALVDFKANYNLTKKLNIGVAMLNVFDKFYFDHLNFAFRNQGANGLSMMDRLSDPGINASIFVKYSF
ncbi:MAG: TonB-dependent receptor [Bacteroidetes bacterium]|jgi:iron complex outermembrane receptor protein|nr:TonB-dependent receptor [Bacteroidota bacterium]